MSKDNFDPFKIFSNIDKSSEQKTNSYAKQIFSKIFTGMQGRYTRLKIINALNEQPMNVNQLSKELGYDYKAIQRNVRVLEDNNLIERTGEGYGDVFFVSDFLMDNLFTLKQVLTKVDRKLSFKKKYI